MIQPSADAFAYIDEAGEKGFLRNLDQSKDSCIALIASLVVPKADFERFRDAFAEPFEAFKSARPAGAGGLHITDAFKPGNEEWAKVARKSRKNIFDLVKCMEVPVVYDARRLRVARQSFEDRGKAITDAVKVARSPIKVSKRPSAERVEEECILGLALKLNALLEDCGLGIVDLLTDQIDSQVAQTLVSMVEHTQTVSQPSEHVIKGFNTETKEVVHGSIRIEVRNIFGQFMPEYDATHIGEFKVIGKDDPLVFAADVVTNHLYRHLSTLAVDAPLNHPASIKGWVLGQRVYGVREDAIEDSI